jgi:hypothetical protein
MQVVVVQEQHGAANREKSWPTQMLRLGLAQLPSETAVVVLPHKALPVPGAELFASRNSEEADLIIEVKDRVISLGKRPPTPVEDSPLLIRSRLAHLLEEQDCTSDLRMRRMLLKKATSRKSYTVRCIEAFTSGWRSIQQ